MHIETDTAPDAAAARSTTELKMAWEAAYGEVGALVDFFQGD